MRWSLYSWLLFIATIAVYTVQAQSHCDENAPKVSFSGKAPAPWAIDGSIADWETILGAPTGNVATPFNPPFSSAFNWWNDYDWNSPVVVHPSPESDIHFTAFTHDDYNVYFYIRRLATGNAPNTFYYFCDVNADGYMNEGEPVFHATIAHHQLTALTLSRYIPDRAALYVAGKGNPFSADYKNGSMYVNVSGYAMPGRLEKVFSADHITGSEHLRKNERFAAAITENGYGAELAIPWRYLRLWLYDKKKEKAAQLENQLSDLFNNQWLAPWWQSWKEKLEKLFSPGWKHTASLQPGDIFFYKLSMQQGGEPYTPAMVVDNVGNCCGGLGRSGNVAFTKNITTTVLAPHQTYRYTVTYTNLTNATEFFEIANIVLAQIKSYSDQVVNPQDVHVNMFVDRNGDGILNDKETKVDFTQDVIAFVYTPSNESEAMTTLPPYGKVSFVVDINLPPGVVESAAVTINPVLDFIPRTVSCIQGGGRVINPVGSVSSSIYKSAEKRQNQRVDEESITDVVVYPNPAEDVVNVWLPSGKGSMDIWVTDFLGRAVQSWKGYTASRLQIDHLKPGVYLLTVQQTKTGKTTTKKIMVK